MDLVRIVFTIVVFTLLMFLNIMFCWLFFGMEEDGVFFWGIFGFLFRKLFCFFLEELEFVFVVSKFDLSLIFMGLILGVV